MRSKDIIFIDLLTERKKISSQIQRIKDEKKIYFYLFY